MNLERILANKELERRGFGDKPELKLHMAKFYLDRGASEETAIYTANKLTQKYFDKLENEGWEVLDTPVCRKVRQIEESSVKTSQLYIPNSTGVWHQLMLATENTIPDTHPWSREGQDMYVIWIKAQRKAEIGVMDIDDDTLKDMVEREDPTLEGIVIH